MFWVSFTAEGEVAEITGVERKPVARDNYRKMARKIDPGAVFEDVPDDSDLADYVASKSRGEARLYSMTLTSVRGRPVAVSTATIYWYAKAENPGFVREALFLPRYGLVLFVAEDIGESMLLNLLKRGEHVLYDSRMLVSV